ncbi:MAG: InlB B-repeat-containing protein, partial [Candidatus Limnocylindria bacterium]
ACASFSQPFVTHDLDVSLAGAGAGSVSSDPAGIDCGADCAETYPAGTAVSLTATPEPGSTFTGWSGDCTGTGPCELSMDADHSVTATFTVVTHDLDVTLAGAGSGSVSSDPAGIDCSSDCSETYPDGTAVTLTAAPEPGSTFTGWSADCSGTASCELSMDADHSVTATFEVEPSADLGVTQTDEPDPVTGGNAVNYAITVTNNGPDAATGVILTDTLPAGHALVGVDDPSCTFASGVVTCPIGSLASGDSADVSITVATTAVSSPTAMINEARVSADQTDPVSSNDSAIAVTTVQPAPDDPDTASGWITAAGGTVETGGGNKPTKRDPMTTSVTVPPGYEGVVTIHEGPITTCPPSYGCFGQQADITAPSTSATAPLRITFSYHPSALPRRTHLQDIVMFHDGVLVGPCVDASGAAAPDPCISSVTRKKGAVRVVVLSSENGSWVGGRR